MVNRSRNHATTRQAASSIPLPPEPIHGSSIHEVSSVGQKTRPRKLPLVIHIDPRQLIALNKTCRYCAHCDLLIAHRDQLESTLAASLSRVAVGSQEYLVLGTMDRAAWRRGTRTPPAVADALEHVHDFAQALRFEPLP